MRRLLLVPAAALLLLLLASCETRHSDAEAAAARYLAEKPPIPTDLPFELPGGTEVDDSRMRVQRAAEAHKDVTERREIFSGPNRTYYYVTDLSPEAVLQFFAEQHPELDPRFNQVQTKEGPCAPPKLGDSAKLSQVKDPRFAPKGPCKQALVMLPDAVVSLQRPTPDLLAGEWVDRTGLRVMFRVKQK